MRMPRLDTGPGWPWIADAADDVITISADIVTGYQMVAAEPDDAGLPGAVSTPSR